MDMPVAPPGECPWNNERMLPAEKHVFFAFPTFPSFRTPKPTPSRPTSHHTFPFSSLSRFLSQFDGQTDRPYQIIVWCNSCFTVEFANCVYVLLSNSVDWFHCRFTMTLPSIMRWADSYFLVQMMLLTWVQHCSMSNRLQSLVSRKLSLPWRTSTCNAHRMSCPVLQLM